jgi:LacI family transcriptional regulator
MKRNTVTIQDIARHAGVSKSTVSMVMNESPSISFKTKEKVLAIIQQLGYQPSDEARKLAQRRWLVAPAETSLVPADPASPAY